MATKKLESISEIPLKDIIANFEWNARSGDFRADAGGEDDEQTFEGLVNSIKSRGQDTAVTVRPKGKKFELTAGFRRYAAISRIAEETKNPNATIKAIVKNQNDIEARSENIRENTARDDLKGPDLAWSVHQLYTLQTAASSTPPTDSALAEEIGMSQPYISKLLRIMKGVTTKVTDQWRNSKVAVSVNDMVTLIGKPKNEQEEEFKRLVDSKGGVSGGQGAHSGTAWLDSAKKKAADIGSLFGKLEKEELIDTAGLSFDTHIDFLIKVNKKATARHRAQIAKAAQKAYDTALNAEDSAPVEDDAE